MSAGLPLSQAVAKTPGSQYCFLGICHRVRTIAETRARIGATETMQASYYDDAARDRFNPRNETSSGEFFRASRPDNAASPILPDGTKILVWNPTASRAAVLRINNAGPYFGRRLIDLSRAAAEKLGLLKSGVATVQVRILEAPTSAEAIYRRGRSYAPVPGFLGSYPSLDMAYVEARRAIGANGRDRAPVAPTYDAPIPVIALGNLLPPPEMGQFTLAAARPAESDDGDAPAASMAAVAMATPFVLPEAAAEAPAPIALPVEVIAIAAPSVPQPRQAPVKVALAAPAPKVAATKSAKQAPIRLAAVAAPATRASPGHQAARHKAPLVAGNQNVRPQQVVAPRRAVPVVVAEDAADTKWIPLALSEPN